MRILAINFGGLGDEILFLPTLKSIRSAHPDWEITLLTEPRSRSITQLTRLIDRNILFDIKKQPLCPGDYLALIRLLRAGKYDTVLSSGSSSRVAMLLFVSGIPMRIGYDSGILSRMLLSRAVRLNKEQYAAYMYHDLVGGLDIKEAPCLPQIDLDAGALLHMKKFLKNEQANVPDAGAQKLVLLHPGTSRLAVQKGIYKTWAAENWCELVRRLLAIDCQVLLCGGPDDDDTIGDIISKLGDSASPGKAGERKGGGGLFINAFGKTGSVKDLAALMHLAHLVICVDSAPMHMAAALQKRLIALFGPTEPGKLLVENERVVAIKASALPEEPGAGNPQTDIRIELDLVCKTALDQLSRVSPVESSLNLQN